MQSHATDGQYKPAAESQTLHILSQPLKVVQTLLRKESVKILIIDRISNDLTNVCFFRPNLGVFNTFLSAINPIRKLLYDYLVLALKTRSSGRIDL